MNVVFDYMYRDYDNWKMPGAVVFANPDGLPLDAATTRLRAACCEENNFNARQAGVPEVYYENTDVEAEQIYHEFCGLELTERAVSDARTLLQFVREFEAARRAGWINSPALDSRGYPLPVGRKTLDGSSIGVTAKQEQCRVAPEPARRRVGPKRPSAARPRTKRPRRRTT